MLTLDGQTQTLDVRLATENTGRWIDRSDLASLRRRSTALLRGTRVGSGQFNVTLAGDLAGVALTTIRPFALSTGDDVVESGEAEIATADISPFLTLLGEGAAVAGVPVAARIVLGRERDASLVQVAGKVSGESVQARLAVRSRSDVTGSITLERLSLPWLLTALALNASPEAQAGTIWPAARFGPSARLLRGGQVDLRVARLDLGRGVRADGASLTALLSPDGLTLRGIDAALNGGRIQGSIALTRQGSLASAVAEGSLREVPLAAFSGPSTLAARLSGTLKVGASAETAAGLIANLGGSGEARLTNLQAPGGDPGGLNRAVDRLLAGDDPLAPRRAESVLAQALAERPLTAAAVAAQISVVSGALRMSPFVVAGGEAVWQGSVGYDLKTMSLDARGILTAKSNPRFWTGAPPSAGLAWKGALEKPVREVDAGALSNALAAIVLQRELEKIEAFEAEASERLRRTQRLDFERQRERDRIVAEEGRLRQEYERRLAEQARLEAERRALAEGERRNAPEPILPFPSALPQLPPPIDIRPPPAIQVRPGG